MMRNLNWKFQTKLICYSFADEMSVYHVPLNMNNHEMKHVSEFEMILSPDKHLTFIINMILDVPPVDINHILSISFTFNLIDCRFEVIKHF